MPPYTSHNFIQRSQPETKLVPTWISKCELPMFQQHPSAAVPINGLPLRVVARAAVKREEALNRDGLTFQQHDSAAVHVEVPQPEDVAHMQCDENRRAVSSHDPSQRVVDAPAAPLRRRSCRVAPSESCRPDRGSADKVHNLERVAAPAFTAPSNTSKDSVQRSWPE